MSDHPASKETLVDPASELNSQEQTLDTFEMSTTETVVDPSAQWATQYANPVIDPSEVPTPAVDESLLFYQADCTDEPSDAVVEADPEPVAEQIEPETVHTPEPAKEPAAVSQPEVISEPVIAESQPVAQPEPVAVAEPVAASEPVVQAEPVAAKQAEPIREEPAKPAPEQSVRAAEPVKAEAAHKPDEPTEPLFRDLDLRAE
ncbi:MAG: ATP-dependent RNA helicase, partial [Rhodopirellula bahusiensis]